MKKLFALFLLTLCLSVNSEDIEAQSAGLNYQNYAAGGAMPEYTQDANGNINNRTLLSTGIVNTVGLTTSSGAGLPTRSDGFIVRFYGFINIPTAGTYYFGGQADDGIRIKVNNVSLVNSWIESGGDFRQSNPITLSAGVVPVEIMYYENGGGQMVNFQWFINGSWQIVPTASLATTSTFFAPPAPTPVYGPSGITQQQQIRRTSNLSQNPNGHNIVAEITGDDNIVTIQQAGGAGHYVSIDISGNVNTVNVLQTSTNATSRHYTEAVVTGGNNSLILQQRDTSKTQFVSVDGNNNAVTTNQKGTGNHYLDLKVTGNNHTAGIIQDGTGSHKATVDLSGTQPWNFNLNQAGSTNKTYTLPHNMSDGSVTSGACYTVGGCSLTINQQ
jgi:hypothetical protein